LKCPICSGYDENDNFTCPKCGREDICGSHYDFDFLVCSDCAGKMNKAIKKSEVNKKFAEKTGLTDEEESELDKNPFYIHTVTCPVCGTPAEQRWFQVKKFAERNIDIDKHVRTYTWTDKDFEKYHPPLYYMWRCFNCFFTESHLEYENPLKDPYSNFRTLKAVFEEKYREDERIEKIVDKLGNNIDYGKMDYYQAVKLHLLAIFIQELIDDEDQRNTLKTGRYYLRLAWLYRELEENVKEKEKVDKKLNKLLQFLKKGWRQIASNEKEALQNAVNMFRSAFKTSKAIKSVVTEVDLLMLITGIYIKLEDIENGMKYANLVLNRGQKSKQKINQRMSNAVKANQPLNADERRHLDIQVKKLDDIMDSARDAIADLQSEHLKKERKRALAIMKKLGEKPPHELREILIKKGIDKRVAVKLAPEPKKKFLGLF